MNKSLEKNNCNIPLSTVAEISDITKKVIKKIGCTIPSNVNIDNLVYDELISTGEKTLKTLKQLTKYNTELRDKNLLTTDNNNQTDNNQTDNNQTDEDQNDNNDQDNNDFYFPAVSPIKSPTDLSASIFDMFNNTKEEFNQNSNKKVIIILSCVLVLLLLLN